MRARACLFAGALAGALVLALLARAVLDVQAPGSGRKESGLLAPLAVSLVGGHGGGRAAQVVEELRDTRGGRRAVLRRHELARHALAELARQGRAPERSWAGNVLGVLDVQDGALQPNLGRSYASRARAAFQEAIRANGAAEDPKFNLELLLTLAEVQRKRQHGAAGRKPSQVPAASAGVQRRHAGQNPPGSGF